MTITRANAAGWVLNDELTSGEINQIDINTTNGLDKRTGSTDILSSQVTVASGGGLTFPTGSALTISDPTVVSVGAGNLAIAATLIGSGTPLLTGYTSVAITSTAQALTSTQAQNSIIKFTGSLSGNTVITFPSTAGYSCIVDNGTVGDGYTLTVTTSGATNGGVQLPSTAVNGVSSTNEKAVEVYCDGTNLNKVVYSMSNQTVSLQNMSVGGTSLVFGVGGNVSTAVGALTINANANTGDLLEINFNGMLLGDGAHTSTASVWVNSTQLTNTIITNTSVVTYVNGASTSYYSVTSTGTYAVTVQLVSNSSGGETSLYAPSSLTVKIIRP